MDAISQVLEEMEEAGKYVSADIPGSRLREWVGVLRPALLRWEFPRHAVEPSNIEEFSLTANLEQRLLRDLQMSMRVTADHEGGGIARFDYERVPYEHRLQAVLTLQGALAHRLELALGREGFCNLLRGVLARLGG